MNIFPLKFEGGVMGCYQNARPGSIIVAAEGFSFLQNMILKMAAPESVTCNRKTPRSVFDRKALSLERARKMSENLATEIYADNGGSVVVAIASFAGCNVQDEFVPLFGPIDEGDIFLMTNNGMIGYDLWIGVSVGIPGHNVFSKSIFSLVRLDLERLQSGRVNRFSAMNPPVPFLSCPFQWPFRDVVLDLDAVEDFISEEVREFLLECLNGVDTSRLLRQRSVA